MAANQPGWYPDPVDPSLQRWWNGLQWSDHVSRGGTTWLLPLAAAAPAKSRRRMPVWAWILISALAIGPALLLSPVVAFLALVVLVTGIVALTKQSPTWLRFGSR